MVEIEILARVDVAMRIIMRVNGGTVDGIKITEYSMNAAMMLNALAQNHFRVVLSIKCRPGERERKLFSQILI